MTLHHISMIFVAVPCGVVLLLGALLLMLERYDRKAVERWDGYRATTVVTRGQQTSLAPHLVENDPPPPRVRALLCWLIGEGEKVVRVESVTLSRRQARGLLKTQMRDAHLAVESRKCERGVA